MTALFNKLRSKKKPVQADKKKDEKKEKKEVKPKTEPEKKEKAKKIQKKKDAEAYKYILKPLITEKATDLSAQNQYVFVVPRSANKIEIAKKIKNIYGVKPVKIRTCNFSGKQVRYGRHSGKTKGWKKAIVILNPEDKIEIYEGV